MKRTGIHTHVGMRVPASFWFIKTCYAIHSYFVFWKNCLQILGQVQKQHRVSLQSYWGRIESDGKWRSNNLGSFLHDWSLHMMNTFWQCVIPFKSTTIFLKRALCEIRVNAYNPILTKACLVNMDVRLVANVYMHVPRALLLMLQNHKEAWVN